MTKYDKIAARVKKFVSIYDDNYDAYWGWTVRFGDESAINTYEARELKNPSARAEAVAYAVRMADVARVLCVCGKALVEAIETGDEARADLAYRLGRMAELETGSAFIFDTDA